MLSPFRRPLLGVALFLTLFSTTECSKDKAKPVVPTSYSLRTTLVRSSDASSTAAAQTGFISCKPLYSLLPPGGCNAIGGDYLVYESLSNFSAGQTVNYQLGYPNGVYTQTTADFLPNSGTVMYLYARFLDVQTHIVTAADKITVELLDNNSKVVQTVAFTGAEALTGSFIHAAGDDPTKYVAITLP